MQPTQLKPYPAYKDSGVPWLDQLPAHWKILRGKNVFTPIDVRSTSGEEELLTVSSKDGVVPRREKQVTMFMAASYVGHKLCWPGDLVINSLWAWATGLGVSRYHGIISSAYGVYRPFPLFNGYVRFFNSLLRSSAYDWELHVRSKGIWISRLQLTDESFLDMPIIIPPTDEAEQIARFLDHIDTRINRYIRAQRKRIALLNEQKQAIIHHAVTRGLDPDVPLRPSGVEWLGDIPAHWEVMPLKRVLLHLIDCEHKTAPAVESSPYIVVRTTAVRNGRLRLEGTYNTSVEGFSEWTKRGKPEPGDVIFTREAPAGEACVVPHGLNLCLGQRTVLMKLDKAKYDPQFLTHMIYSGPPSDDINIASRGSTVGHFNMEDIAVMPVLVPPLHEQLLIIQGVESEIRQLYHIERQAEHQITLIREYRTRLIADVVTGKLDVREAAAALPEELEAFEPGPDEDGEFEAEPDEEQEAIIDGD